MRVETFGRGHISNRGVIFTFIKVIYVLLVLLICSLAKWYQSNTVGHILEFSGWDFESEDYEIDGGNTGQQSGGNGGSRGHT